MAKVPSIDSGTTNCGVAVIAGGELAARARIESKRTTPSVVAFTKTGDGKVRMNQAHGPVDLLKIGLGVALLTALMGCVGVGYVEPGYGGAVVVPGPDVFHLGSQTAKIAKAMTIYDPDDTWTPAP